MPLYSQSFCFKSKKLKFCLLWDDLSLKAPGRPVLLVQKTQNMCKLQKVIQETDLREQFPSSHPQSIMWGKKNLKGKNFINTLKVEWLLYKF